MSAEEAVRSYLRWLEDPTSMRDAEAIAAATEEAASAADPLDRLRALSRLQALETVDGDSFRDGFVAEAALWARENNVTPEAFVTYGIPTEVLRDAGILHDPKPARRSAKPRTRVSPEAVRAAIPSGPFTIAELEQASGASTATVRKVIAEMTEAGTLLDLGPDQQHSGRGRAPLRFTRA